jgi:hypothetical protein
MSVNSIWQKAQDFLQTHVCELHLWRNYIEIELRAYVP